MRVPAKSEMTVHEALNWIAFRDPIDADITGLTEILIKWPRHDWTGAGSHPGIEYLELRVRDPSRASSEPPRNVKQAYERLILEAGKPPSVLLSELEGEVAGFRARDSLIREALAMLLNSIRSAKLDCVASPTAPSETNPFLLIEEGDSRVIPREYFWSDQIEFRQIGNSSRWVVTGGPGWLGTSYTNPKFLTEQVINLWPPREALDHKPKPAASDLVDQSHFSAPALQLAPRRRGKRPVVREKAKAKIREILETDPSIIQGCAGR